ncbi:hypothetical protein Pth03_42210 [Planotetraspora thailandica]|uniref:Uncharacterized protein n=1 Tax=Planotetraspora thailandica TaxID=487172 RepID=A0A8J3V1Y6_9ACTN|nr:hypothetical protein [Planotetraspora thailandica]GII55832.1 hypothetical protein Pth03_42210 [Planotetraspora thailandica]
MVAIGDVDESSDVAWQGLGFGNVRKGVQGVVTDLMSWPAAELAERNRQFTAPRTEMDTLVADRERADRKWRLLRSVAGQSVIVAAGEIERNTVRKGVDYAGNEVDVELDVDWWSDGRFEALHTRIDGLPERIGDQKDPPGPEELRSIIGEQAPRLKEEPADTVQSAGPTSSPPRSG